VEKDLNKEQPELVLANLDRCTDGDPEFKRELAVLLANNIIELMANMENALQKQDAGILIRAVHKTKTTLGILNDSEINEGISFIQKKLKESPNEDLSHVVQLLKKRCDRTIVILNSFAAA